MQDDAAFIKKVISSVVDSGKEVIVVMSSYGGYPGTKATEGLGKVDLQKQGKQGGVMALVYVASWIPMVRKSIFTLQGEPEILKNTHGVLTYPGYKFIPTTCLIPDSDFIIATDIQKEQVAREEREGVKITMHELKGVGHAPIITIPGKVTDLLINAAKAS